MLVARLRDTVASGRGRGRPPKKQNEKKPERDPLAPKRPIGRPRKVPLEPDADGVYNIDDDSDAETVSSSLSN